VTGTVDHLGCRLAYEVRGSGPPVLFIQGVGAQGDAWRPQVEGLADRFTCLTFDNRGMARSRPNATPVTVAQMADDARAILDAVGWDTAHVVGHSLGGLVAQQLALDATKRVRSLALLCTFANGRTVAPLSWRMIWLGLGTMLGTRRMRRMAFLRLVLPPGGLAGIDADALAARLADLFGHDLAEQPPVALEQLRAMRMADVSPRLGDLANVPTLVISAAHDPIAPPALGRAIADGVPGARYVEVADTSHGMPITHTDRVNSLLGGHLAPREG